MRKRTGKDAARVAAARRQEEGREILLEELEPRILFSTFTVTNTFDSPFLTIPNSLRWAIESANSNPGFDTIDFDIGAGGQRTIDIDAELPGITGPTLIDGTTQGGYAGDPLIVLDGSSAGFNSDGLRLFGDGITVRGLVIQDFGNHGITVFGDNNVIEDNYVGVGVDGVSSHGNDRDGIHADTASGTIIRGNVIGNNRESGIDLSEAGTNNTVVQGNWIGTDKTGTVNLGNHYHGVHITDSLFGGESEDNSIGGTGAGEGNVIAFNREDGVHVNDGDRNEIRGNAIYENNSLAIDHEGSGNENLVAPTITAAYGDAASVRLLGSYSGAASSTYDIDLFSNPDSDREGRVYLGSTTVVTDGSGNANFDVTLGTTIQVGDYVTGTATDASGNTSEFSTAQLADLAPTANDDSYSVKQGGVLVKNVPGVLGNDSDPEGGGMTVTLVSDVSRGVLTFNADGSFIYTHGGVGMASDSFTYTATDGTGVSNVGTVTISVTPQSPPVAGDDPDVPGAYTTDEDTVLVVNAASGLLANDSDADLDPLTVQSVDPSALLATALSVNADGSFSYDPRGAFEGLAAGEVQNDTFQYTVSDGRGGIDTATVTIVVTGANDAPTAVDNETLLDEDTATLAQGNLITDNDGLGYDSDPDSSDVLTVSGVDGVVDPATNVVGTYGILDWATDGSYSYSLDTASPAVQALNAGETATDVFTYTLDDGNGGTDTAALTVTIVGLNDTPVATANTRSIAEDASTPVSGNLLTDDDGPGVDTDADAGDSLTISEIDGVTLAVIDVAGTYGTLDWSSNGDYTYTLDSGIPAVQALAVGETLTDVFTYTVEDGNGATDTATLTITITGSNDGPTATANTNTIAEDAAAPVSGNVLTDDDGFGVDSDLDTSDALSVSGVDGVLDPATDVVGSYGTLDWAADGSYSYAVDNGNPAVQSLAVGETLTDVFTYTLADGNGGTDTATLTITVTGSNDVPTATANTNTISEDTLAPVSGNVISDDDGFGADSDPDGSDALSISGVDGVTDPAADVVGSYGTLDWAADGSYSYAVDNANAAVQSLAVGETLTDVFTYTLTDGNGGTDTATLTITITGANDGPTATANVNAISEDAVAPVLGNVLTDDDGFGVDSDLDGSDALSVSGVDGVIDPATDAVGSYGTLDWATDGSYSYAVDNGNPAVQALAVGETLTDVFTYTLSDGNGGTDTAPLRIVVTGNNDAPVAADNLAAAAEDAGPVGGNLLLDDDGLGRDADIDNGDLIRVTSVQGSTDPAVPVAGAYGSLQWAADGSWTYTADDTSAAVQGLSAGQSVTEVFSYTIADAAGSSDSALLTVTVTGTNDAPVVTGGLSFSVDLFAPPGTVVGQLQVADADLGDVLQYQLLGGVGASAFSVDSATGIIRYLGLDALIAGATSGDTATLNIAVTDSGGAPPVTALVNVDLQGTFSFEGILDPTAAPQPVDGPGSPPATTSPTPVASTDPPLVVAAPPAPAAEPGRFSDAAGGGERIHFSKLGARAATEPPGDAAAQQLALECHDATEQSPPPAPNTPLPVLSAPELPPLADQVAAQERAELVHASLATTAVLGLSAGFITFVLRAGSLFATLLASLPVWCRLDVLSVLALSERERKEREDAIAREEEAELRENEALARLFGEAAGPLEDRASPLG